MTYTDLHLQAKTDRDFKARKEFRPIIPFPFRPSQVRPRCAQTRCARTACSNIELTDRRVELGTVRR